MKKHNNIPLKERIRNDNRVFRHEVRLEELQEKRRYKNYMQMYESLPEDTRTEKEIEFERQFAELKARLGIESEDTE